MTKSQQNVRNNELKTDRLKVSPFVTGFIPRLGHVGTATSSLHKARQRNYSSTALCLFSNQDDINTHLRKTSQIIIIIIISFSHY